MNDAFRFLSYHADTISFNALHVYHSALPFTPTETQLRKIYAHELETSVKARCGVERGWDPTVMVIWCKAPICGVSWSPDGRFIAAAGSNSIEIRDTLTGSSVVSIDWPKPWFYVSSYIDEVDVRHRLKELVQIPAMPIEGRTVESRLVKAFKHAEHIASLTPISSLKNVLGSLLSLINAGFFYEDHQSTHIRELKSRIRSFTGIVLMQIKEKELSDVPRQLVNDLEEFTRRVQHRASIPVTDHFQRTIESITATCRQKLSQGRLERFEVVTADKSAHLTREVSILCSCVSGAIEQFIVSPVENNSFTVILTRYSQERESMQLLKNVVEVKRRVSESPVDEFQLSTTDEK